MAPSTQAPPWLVVARREVVAKLTDTAFLIGTALSLALLAGVLGFQAYSANKGSTYRVAVTGDATTLVRDAVPVLKEVAEKDTLTPVPVADEAAARAAVSDGTADAWLHPKGQGWALTGKDEVDPTLRQAVQVALQREVLADTATQLGTSSATLAARSTLTSDLVKGDTEAANFAMAAAYILAILFYISVLGYGMTIAMSVVEEKQSRIVEVIATKIPIRQLLAGKVLGNSALALAQMALYVVVGLVGASFTSWSGLLPSLSGAMLWYVVFFLVGFLVLASLWAAAGSLATRTEDVQTTALPLTMLSVGMFFAAFFLKGTALTVASFVPPISAILMPMRLVQGTAAWWEPVVALALLLLAAAGIVRVAERLYRRALLQTQGRLSVRKAWSAPS